MTLAKHQAYGSVPSITSFSAFIGAFGLIVAAIGLLSLWTDKIPKVAVLGADALSSLLFVAGAIVSKPIHTTLTFDQAYGNVESELTMSLQALTVSLKGISSCSSDSLLAQSERSRNKILNGGCFDDDGTTRCNWGIDGTDEDFTPGRCKRARADNVFQYIGFLCTGIAVIITYLIRRRDGRSGAYV